jgi:hypothetical protein
MRYRGLTLQKCADNASISIGTMGKYLRQCQRLRGWQRRRLALGIGIDTEMLEGILDGRIDFLRFLGTESKKAGKIAPRSNG